jgi:hypothetical protein
MAEVLQYCQIREGNGRRVHENKNPIFFTVSALAHRRVLFADGEDSYAKTSHAGAGGRGNRATGLSCMDGRYWAPSWCRGSAQ